MAYKFYVIWQKNIQSYQDSNSDHLIVWPYKSTSAPLPHCWSLWMVHRNSPLPTLTYPAKNNILSIANGRIWTAELQIQKQLPFIHLHNRYGFWICSDHFHCFYQCAITLNKIKSAIYQCLHNPSWLLPFLCYVLKRVEQIIFRLVRWQLNIDIQAPTRGQLVIWHVYWWLGHRKLSLYYNPISQT